MTARRAANWATSSAYVAASAKYIALLEAARTAEASAIAKAHATKAALHSA